MCTKILEDNEFIRYIDETLSSFIIDFYKELKYRFFILSITELQSISKEVNKHLTSQILHEDVTKCPKAVILDYFPLIVQFFNPVNTNGDAIIDSEKTSSSRVGTGGSKKRRSLKKRGGVIQNDIQNFIISINEKIKEVQTIFLTSIDKSATDIKSSFQDFLSFDCSTGITNFVANKLFEEFKKHIRLVLSDESYKKCKPIILSIIDEKILPCIWNEIRATIYENNNKYIETLKKKPT